MIRDYAHAAQLQEQADFFAFDRRNADKREGVLTLEGDKIGDYEVYGDVKLTVWHDGNVDAEFFPQNDFRDLVDVSGLYAYVRNTKDDLDETEVSLSLLNNSPSIIEIEQHIVDNFERFSNYVYLEN